MGGVKVNADITDVHLYDRRLLCKLKTGLFEDVNVKKEKSGCFSPFEVKMYK